MMSRSSMKIIPEPNTEVKVCRECDVVVVGGGPGGIGAAVAAARNGADTVLIERYGYLGGMGTGGLVTIIPCLSDFDGNMQIGGINQEWIERLTARGAETHPPAEIWGSDDKRLTSYWNDRSFFSVREGKIVYASLIDAEVSKCILNEMVKEAGANCYLDSWGTMPVMEGDKATGVIFESKSGRQAVMAKVVIDSTGDGDLLPFTPAGFDTDIDPRIRIANLSLCFWVDGVNYMKMDDFRHDNPQRWGELMRELTQQGGLPGFFRSNLKNQENIVWFHPRYACTSQIDVDEITRVEILGREKMLFTHDYFKKYIPGFENSFIVLSSPQLGTRGARRVHGDYMMTEKDLQSDEPFEDTIAVFPDLDRGEDSLKHPLTYIPYRSLLPTGVENMLVACRAFSSDQVVNNFFNLIPHCVAFGEAAGTAAALSLRQGVSVREVEFNALRGQLLAQDVPLPGNLGKNARKGQAEAFTFQAPAFAGRPPAGAPGSAPGTTSIHSSA
ncbi:MAG: FAD-dependent oxidoreductase [Dehalococcoidales bacterium]|nr:FAD-dependent oxidoreductase [Dehalococcoidales bacterium]